MDTVWTANKAKISHLEPNTGQKKKGLINTQKIQIKTHRCHWTQIK